MRARWSVVKLCPGRQDQTVSTHRWERLAHRRAVRAERDCPELGARYAVREVTA